MDKDAASQETSEDSKNNVTMYKQNKKWNDRDWERVIFQTIFLRGFALSDVVWFTSLRNF